MRNQEEEAAKDDLAIRPNKKSETLETLRSLLVFLTGTDAPLKTGAPEAAGALWPSRTVATVAD